MRVTRALKLPSPSALDILPIRMALGLMWLASATRGETSWGLCRIQRITLWQNSILGGVAARVVAWAFRYS